MDRNQNLATMFLGQSSQQRGELSDVNFIHRLNWVVQDEPRKLGFY